MAGERKYEQGKFENYYPERNELRSGVRERYRNEGDRRSEDVRGGFLESQRSSQPAYRNEEKRDQQNGPHKGKGPRGYQRKDERILEDFNDRLCDNPYLDASDIEVSVAGGNVVLTGTVEDREAKRMAEDIGESVSGVKNVENKLRVKLKGI